MSTEGIVKFFSEIGFLKRYRTSGFYMVGEVNPPTVAEHSYRAAAIASVLAELEGADVEKVACMLLFHDMPESRVGDQNKVSARYFKKNEAEQKAALEQVQDLPAGLASRILNYRKEFEERNTKEGIVAKDADWLEQAITAKELVEKGYHGAQNWIDNVEKALETDSAKEILKLVKGSDFTNSWWQGLKKMTYKKLEDK